MSVPAPDRIALGSYACETRSGRVSLSASLRQIAGLPDIESLSLDEFLAHIHPADRDGVALATQGTAKAVPRLRLCRFVPPEGDTRWTVLRADAVRGESGAVERVAGLVIDATPSYEAFRAALAAGSTRGLAAAVAASPVAFLVVADGRTVDVNEAATHLLGITRAEALDRPLEASSWTPLQLDRLLAQRELEETTVGQVVRFRRSDERTTYLLVVAARVRPGGPIAVGCIDATVRFDGDRGALTHEGQLHQLAERAAEGIAFTESGIITDCNERFAQSLGYTPDELNGRALAELLNGAASEALDRLTAEGADPYVEHLRLKDGRRLPFELSARAIQRAGRTIRVTTLRDASERERADRAVSALRDSREQFRELAEAHGEGVVLVDEERIVHANSKFASMLGYELAALIGRPWSTLVALDPGRAPGPRADVEDPYVWTATRHDGTAFPVEVSPRTIQADGRLYRILTIRDVTRRERADQLRRDLVAATAGVTGVEFFRALVRHLAAALEVRHAFLAEYAGTPPSRVAALSVWRESSYGPLFDRPLAGTPCDLVMECGLQSFSREVASLFPTDGLLVDLSAKAYVGAPLIDGRGRPVGVLAVLHDEALDRLDAAEDLVAVFAARASVELERLRGEEAIRRLNADLERRVADRTADLQAANRELEAFSYSVSHDLRAPLRHIDGFLNLMRADRHSTFGPASQEHVTEIETAVTRMTTLIDRLLELSRLARVEVQARPVDLTPLAREVADELNQDAGGRDVRWTFESIDPVWGDPVLLRQVLANLLGNALKYTRPRPVATVTVGPAESARPDEVVFAVRDNGVGFDMKYAGKLFGVFQRLHPESRFEGTGVGLANVERIVTRHGGRVWAESRVNQGATFFVALPAVTTPSPAA